ncbi:MAG: hypothetical protein ACU0CV_11845, partial [Sagittula sp.]
PDVRDEIVRFQAEPCYSPQNKAILRQAATTACLSTGVQWKFSESNVLKALQVKAEIALCESHLWGQT